MSEDLFNVAPAFYGMSLIPEKYWKDYGFALLVIAGSDGEVSDPELEWLTISLGQSLKVDEATIAAWEEYDFEEDELESVFQRINSVSVASFNKLLIYDAIRMSYADDDYADDERARVGEAAAMLGLNKDVVMAIEVLVEQERATDKLRSIVL